MTCGILFPAHSVLIEDATGCLLPESHGNHHFFKAKDGRTFQWEVAYSCNCHCCQSEDATDWCTLYEEVK